MDLKGRDFLKLLDFTPEEIEYLPADLKDKKKKGIPVDTLRGKNVALIFEKTSTRTRCAFEVAAHDLGMGTTYLDPTGSQIGKKESIADTARVSLFISNMPGLRSPSACARAKSSMTSARTPQSKMPSGKWTAP